MLGLCSSAGLPAASHWAAAGLVKEADGTTAFPDWPGTSLPDLAVCDEGGKNSDPVMPWGRCERVYSKLTTDVSCRGPTAVQRSVLLACLDGASGVLVPATKQQSVHRCSAGDSSSRVWVAHARVWAGRIVYRTAHQRLLPLAEQERAAVCESLLVAVGSRPSRLDLAGADGRLNRPGHQRHRAASGSAALLIGSSKSPGEASCRVIKNPQVPGHSARRARRRGRESSAAARP